MFVSFVSQYCSLYLFKRFRALDGMESFRSENSKALTSLKTFCSRKNFLYLITFYILSLFVDQLCNKLVQSCYLIKVLLYTGERMSVAADVWVVL